MPNPGLAPHPAPNAIKDDVNQMKKNFKLALVTFVLLATALFCAACGNVETPYDKNDAEGFTVSIRYDANGGFFATSTSIVMDSYNISDLKAGSNGMVQLGLLAPEDTRRGDTDTFKATKNGYFLAGWYTERNESTDSEGNTIYTYAGKWDFSKDVLDVDPTESYNSAEPVLTLYAAWVPMYEVNFIDKNTGDSISTYTYNPLNTTELKIPQYDTTTGKISMERFPQKKGYTFDGAYENPADTQKLNGSIQLPTEVLENGVPEKQVKNVYVEYKEGEWYEIYTVKQLKDNASPMGNYILKADLDFEGTSWPGVFANGIFSGSIQGENHTIKNVTLEQTDTGAARMGLFGALSADSKLENVTFENITFTIKKGFTRGEPSFGLLAGELMDGAAISGVQILNSVLQIDSGAHFASDMYNIGLICGSGNHNLIANAQITYKAVGDEAEKVTITVDSDGNTVTVQFA